MKLFCMFAAFLAFTFAEDTESIADSEAAASIELLKESRESLEPAASVYNYVPGNAQNGFLAPKKYSDYYPSQNYYVPTKPQNNYNQPQNDYIPPQNSYVPPQNSYVPPQNSYVPPQNSYVPPQNSYVPPQNNYVPPQNNYVPPQNNYVPPQNDYVPPSNTYYPPTNTWAPPTGYPSSTTTTTPSPVIKNEIIYGDNGSYRYEYKYADGTWVGEEGYFTNPKRTDESLVKKGWYSYPGADGKIYTVSYWADHTGFHATGDHLPTPPPVPAAIQAALDQKQKEEAEKNKPQQGYYTTQKPTYYPQQPTYNPQQPTYVPQQPAYNPQPPAYNPPQPTYKPPQSGYYPPQSQQTYS